MSKRTNQNFVQIPHARFIAMLSYKAELVGIRVKITEESYLKSFVTGPGPSASAQYRQREASL